jgi:hypothetical protein
LPEGLASLGAKQDKKTNESQRELVFFCFGEIKGVGDT